MFIGGTLIRRFDGFRRLSRRAGVDFQYPVSISDEDLLLANRILAALGGPPAPPEVKGNFNSDGLPLLLLFLLTQEMECRVGLIGDAEPIMVRLKSLVHLFSHAVYPMVSGKVQLQFQEVTKELGPGGVVLRPLVIYDPNGEPTEIELSGAAGTVRVGSEAGPYTLAVLLGEGAGPAPLARADSALHPAVLLIP